MTVSQKDIARYLNNACAIYPASGDSNIPAGTISAGKRTWSKVFDVRTSASAIADKIRFIGSDTPVRVDVSLSPSVASPVADVHMKLDQQTLTFTGDVVDGELINVGGTVYQILADGSITPDGDHVGVQVGATKTAVNAHTQLLAAYIAGGAPVATSISTTAVRFNALKPFELSANGANMDIVGAVRLRDGVATVDVVTEGTFVATDAIDVDVASLSMPDGRSIPGATATLNVV